MRPCLYWLVLNCRIPRRRGIHLNERACGQSRQVSTFIQISSFRLRRIRTIETPKQSARAFNSTFKRTLIQRPQTAPNQRRAKGKHMRFQDASLMLKPRNPCPVCGDETALAEIEPHPLHANFEIHGYLCDRCGPIKSLVVLRSPPLPSMMQVRH